MNNGELEKRVAKLEQEVVKLREQIRSAPKKDWRKTVGMFANDPLFDEIVARGKEYRDQQNQEVE